MATKTRRRDPESWAETARRGHELADMATDPSFARDLRRAARYASRRSLLFRFVPARFR